MAAPTVPSSSSAGAPELDIFPFQSLSGELRSRIWRLAALPTDGFVHRMHLHDVMPILKPSNTLAASTADRRAVMGVCRESRAEAEAVLSASLEFYCRHPDGERWMPNSNPDQKYRRGMLRFDPASDTICLVVCSKGDHVTIHDIGVFVKPHTELLLPSEEEEGEEKKGEVQEESYPSNWYASWTFPSVDARYRHRLLQWRTEIQQLGVELANNPGPGRSALPGDLATMFAANAFIASFPRLQSLAVLVAPVPPDAEAGPEGQLSAPYAYQHNPRVCQAAMWRRAVMWLRAVWGTLGGRARAQLAEQGRSTASMVAAANMVAGIPQDQSRSGYSGPGLGEDAWERIAALEYSLWVCAGAAGRGIYELLSHS